MFRLVRYALAISSGAVHYCSFPSLSGLIARKYLLSVLKQGIQVGELCIHEGEVVTVFGTPSKIKEPVNIYVRDERFWTHVLLYVAFPPPCHPIAFP